jgi:hypothetical protein
LLAESSPLSSTILVEDYKHAILAESEPFHSVGVDVRQANKKEFEPARQQLRKNWPDFDKHYDAYRQWRDSPPDKCKDFEAAGRAAQLAIMKRSGVAGSGMMQLFKLLSKPPSPLLRFVSPVNGDFRAPKQGIVAGFRYAIKGDKKVPTLAFPGTGAGSMIRAQMRTNFNQFIGKRGVPDAHQLGTLLARQCRQALITQQPMAQPLAFTGHSLGGGIASYASAMIAEPNNGYVPRCYTFNPAALGGAIQTRLKQLKDLSQRTAGQKIIRIKNDHVSSPAMQERLNALMSMRTRKPMTVPRHYGQVHVIRRELLEKSNQNILVLHSLESLISVYAHAGSGTDRADSTK